MTAQRGGVAHQLQLLLTAAHFAHPSLKSFPVIYLCPSLLRVLAGAGFGGGSRRGARGDPVPSG